MHDEIIINKAITIPLSDVQLDAVRAQGAGGQNVNKVASAIHLRFDISASSLPQTCKDQLLARADQRVTKEGVLVIKAQRFRTQEQNREDALQRLAEWIRYGIQKQRKRIPTKPSRAAKQRRLQAKQQRAQVKSMRGKVRHDG